MVDMGWQTEGPRREAVKAVAHESQQFPKI
jgi:hypothetical protein